MEVDYSGFHSVLLWAHQSFKCEQVAVWCTWTWERMAPRNRWDAVGSAALKCPSSRIQTQVPWVPEIAGIFSSTKWGQGRNVKLGNLRMALAIDWVFAVILPGSPGLTVNPIASMCYDIPFHPISQMSSQGLRPPVHKLNLHPVILAHKCVICHFSWQVCIPVCKLCWGKKSESLSVCQLCFYLSVFLFIYFHSV